MSCDVVVECGNSWELLQYLSRAGKLSNDVVSHKFLVFLLILNEWISSRPVRLRGESSWRLEAG